MVGDRHGVVANRASGTMPSAPLFIAHTPRHAGEERQLSASQALAKTILQPKMPALPKLEKLAEVKLSSRGPLRVQLAGQGIPPMLRSPQRSVLVEKEEA